MKSNGKIVHRNVLKPSDEDLVKLGQAVETNFKDVMDTHVRLMGFGLIPQSEIQNDMLLWREMVMRHNKGDRRHTDSEKRATRQVAQWTLDVNCWLRNQEPKKLVWKD